MRVHSAWMCTNMESYAYKLVARSAHVLSEIVATLEYCIYSGKFLEGRIFGKVRSNVLGKNIRKYNFWKIGSVTHRCGYALIEV